MSSFGRPYPGPPGGRDHDPPADPWGDDTARLGGYDASPSYDPTRYDPSGHDPLRYPEPGTRPLPSDPDPDSDPLPGPRARTAWETPPPRRHLGLYALVTLLVVLAATGVGYALYLLISEDGGPVTATPPGPTSTGAPPTDESGPSPTQDNLGLNAAMARVGDCLINDGSQEQPQLRVVVCDTDEPGEVFQILEIFDQRVGAEGADPNDQAHGICSGTEGYTHHYYEVGDATSFVLCMALRD